MVDYKNAAMAEAMQRAFDALGRGQAALAREILDDELNRDERGVPRPAAQANPNIVAKNRRNNCRLCREGVRHLVCA